MRADSLWIPSKWSSKLSYAPAKNWNQLCNQGVLSWLGRIYTLQTRRNNATWLLASLYSLAIIYIRPPLNAYGYIWIGMVTCWAISLCRDSPEIGSVPMYRMATKRLQTRECKLMWLWSKTAQEMVHFWAWHKLMTIRSIGFQFLSSFFRTHKSHMCTYVPNKHT